MPNRDPEKKRLYNRAYYAAHAEELRRGAREDYAAHWAKRRVQHAIWMAEHKEEQRLYRAKRYSVKRKTILEKAAVYRAAHCEQLRAKAAAYRRANPATVKATQKASMQTEAGKKRNRANAKRHKALKRQIRSIAPERICTRQQWECILELAKGRCYWCNRKMKKLTQDHVIPLSKGGLHVAENIVAACLSCNVRKHAKIITLF